MMIEKLTVYGNISIRSKIIQNTLFREIFRIFCEFDKYELQF